MTKINQEIESIANGNYSIQLKESNNKFLEELNILTNSVNQLSHKIRSNIVLIDNNYMEMVDVMIKAIEIKDHYTSSITLRWGFMPKLLQQKLDIAS